MVDAIASLVEKDSGFVFDVLDGKFGLPNAGKDLHEKPEVNGEKDGNGNRINYRAEPVAFFFVLFGLAFEALVDQAGVPPPQRLAILQTLQKILHPSVAGNAIYQDAVFSETMDTLDRLVMTEGSNVQKAIVEISRKLSLHHQSAQEDQIHAENLSDDIEQLFELTRNIILVLAGLLPNLSESLHHARFNISDESVSLIRLALSSLVDVTSVFPSIIRADLHACILHIFSTILGTGLYQAEIVPQALPIFRRFIQGLAGPKVSSQSDSISTPSEDSATQSRQIRGCVARFLDILTIAQRRESETSLPCARNTLLALTILLTTGGHAIPPQDPLIPQVLNEFLDCLQDLGLASVAAGCIRSLLLNPAPRSPTDDTVARFLLPRLVGFFVGTPSGSQNEAPTDPENTKTSIAHTLVSFICSTAIPPNALPSAISIIVPALLERARKEGEVIFRETAARLLELAKANQVAFRTFITIIPPEQRVLTEEILRTAGTGAGPGQGHKGYQLEGGEKRIPSIVLRMDL